MSQINSDKTLEILHTLPKEEQLVIQEEMCNCNLDAHSQYFSSTVLLSTTALSIAGFVVCPFTFGIGCTVAGYGAVALTGMSSVNTALAIKDHLYYEPVTSAFIELPGMSYSEKEKTLNLHSRAQGRMIMGALEVSMGTGVQDISFIARRVGDYSSAKHAIRKFIKSIYGEDIFILHKNSASMHSNFSGKGGKKGDSDTYFKKKDISQGVRNTMETPGRSGEVFTYNAGEVRPSLSQEHSEVYELERRMEVRKRLYDESVKGKNKKKILKAYKAYLQSVLDIEKAIENLSSSVEVNLDVVKAPSKYSKAKNSAVSSDSGGEKPSFTRNKKPKSADGSTKMKNAQRSREIIKERSRLKQKAIEEKQLKEKNRLQAIADREEAQRVRRWRASQERKLKKTLNSKAQLDQEFKQKYFSGYETHYIDHGKDWGNITEDEYIRKAIKFSHLKGREKESFLGTDNQVYHYSHATGEFLVVNDGKILTFFKAKLSHWLTKVELFKPTK